MRSLGMGIAPMIVAILFLLELSTAMSLGSRRRQDERHLEPRGWDPNVFGNHSTGPGVMPSYPIRRPTTRRPGSNTNGRNGRNGDPRQASGGTSPDVNFAHGFPDHYSSTTRPGLYQNTELSTICEPPVSKGRFQPAGTLFPGDLGLCIKINDLLIPRNGKIEDAMKPLGWYFGPPRQTIDDDDEISARTFQTPTTWEIVEPSASCRFTVRNRFKNPALDVFSIKDVIEAAISIIRECTSGRLRSPRAGRSQLGDPSLGFELLIDGLSAEEAMHYRSVHH